MSHCWYYCPTLSNGGARRSKHSFWYFLPLSLIFNLLDYSLINCGEKVKGWREETKLLTACFVFFTAKRKHSTWQNNILFETKCSAFSLASLVHRLKKKIQGCTVNTDTYGTKKLPFSQCQTYERLQPMMWQNANYIFYLTPTIKVFSEAFPKSPQQIWQRIQLWHPELKQTWVGHWSLPSLWRYCTVRSWPFSGELALVDWSSSTCRAARGQTGWRQASREQEQMWDQSERILAKCHVRWCVLHYIIPLSTETGWSTCALLGGGE